MIIKQAIAEGHDVNPEVLLKEELQRMYVSFDAEVVEKYIFATVVAVAGEVGCYFKIEEAPVKTDSTIYFWSVILGEKWPQSQADPAPIEGEPFNEERLKTAPSETEGI